jgi:biotin/methionine sulfoxide reductase
MTGDNGGTGQPADGRSAAHWGAFLADGSAEDLRVRPLPGDTDPSPLLGNVRDSVRSTARVAQPAVRAGWLERGPGPDARRGSESFVPVTWDEATELVAAELRLVLDAHGPAAVYGSSYGWASAGRFHHCQSQVHRFLNVLGGYTRSVNNYSFGTSSVVLPRVIGSHLDVMAGAAGWRAIEEHTEFLLCFGGMPLKNSHVTPGGKSGQGLREQMHRLAARGLECTYLSPLRDDVSLPGAQWLSPLPGTDVAVMLGIAHVLATEGLADRRFLSTHCSGYETFERYLLGQSGGAPRTPEWAQSVSSVPAGEIRRLAHRLVERRSLINVSWSLQRTRFGEQAPWAAVVLAAMVGQIGLPGGGVSHGYGSTGDVGADRNTIGLPTLPQGHNPVDSFIPVARIADMLLHPGEAFDYDGGRHTYPDVRLLYWAGGNPFHHHQDLARLRRAFGRPDTVVVHEPYWTATARCADVVLPSTIALERVDMAASKSATRLLAMRQVLPPHEEAKDDYEILSGLAAALGVEQQFTEGRTAGQWVRHLYEQWRTAVAGAWELPPFDVFWEAGYAELPVRTSESSLAGFRMDPVGQRLATPSGRIEVHSPTIASFGYPDCPGHPSWLEPEEWAERHRFPLHLVANQPATRLHSQLDMGSTSRASKVAGREPVRVHPDDAGARGIGTGDVVRVFNDRGSCLAGAVVSDAVRPGVVQLSTGAWYDPEDWYDAGSMCVHGNVNVLTADVGASRLSQGTSGAVALVELERFHGTPPPVRAHQPPPLVPRPATPGRRSPHGG